MGNIVEVVNLQKCFTLTTESQTLFRLFKKAINGRHYYKEILALNNINFKLKKGEKMGLIGDNGSEDKSIEIVKELIRKGMNIRLYKCPNMRINGLTDFLLKKTSFRWVMKWDADFVARTDGEFSIHNLCRTHKPWPYFKQHPGPLRI